MVKQYFFRYFELSVWTTGLLLLAMMNPAGDHHFSLCLFRWMGWSFCPGCGLGHSISWLFRGEIAASVRAHPLGLLAVAVLLHRIYVLIQKNKTPFLTP
ncbi:MAG: DUF2752 domain-containing protein [Ferruginibacter sp.]